MRPMREVATLLAFAAACGCGNSAPQKHDAATQGSDAAPMLPPACASPSPGTNITMRKIAKVSNAAMLVTSPPGDTRLFVVEREGGIRIIDNEQLKPAPFLDVSNAIVSSSGQGEQGLLGLAFDPNYATNREFYVFYTSDNPVSGGDPYVDVIARYTASPTDPNVASPTGTIVLSIPDFASNHNGGMIEFGADGFLYIGTGDGGSAGDPNRNAQDPSSLLGKILRIDVHDRASGQYGTPADNPFADGVAGAREVFILGVRNPWRWSFDRANGDMWIGDVGQNWIEEVDVLKAGEQSGKNLGWSMFEGSECCATLTQPGGNAAHCNQGTTSVACVPGGKVLPLDERLHSTGWNAIIGGQVYRGACYPDLVGWYFYTDNGKGGLVKARLKADNTLEIVDQPGTFPAGPASLHADARGELYETDVMGNVYHLEAGM